MRTVAIYKQVKKYRDNKRQPNNVDSCESSVTVYNMSDFVNQTTHAITIDEHKHQL